MADAPESPSLRRVPENRDRLAELLRQRALVREQLEWLDREIAAAGGESNAGGPVAQPAEPVSAPTTAADNSPEYAPDPITAHENAKRGCLIYFFGALLLFFALLVAIYFLRYRNHPILF